MDHGRGGRGFNIYTLPPSWGRWERFSNFRLVLDRQTGYLLGVGEGEKGGEKGDKRDKGTEGGKRAG